MKNILNIFLILFITISTSPESLSSDTFPLKAKINLSESYDLNKRVFGIHGELLWSPVRLGDPLLSDIYNDVGFQDIRLPGGAAGNHFLSQTSKFGCNKPKPIGDKTKDRIEKYNRALSRKNRTYSTEDFLSFIKQAKTDFTLIINVLCDTPENTRKWMEQIRDSGVNVKYAEMGSEYYFKEYIWAFPTPDEYIKQAERHAVEVKRIFPDVKIGLDYSVSSYRSRHFPDFDKMSENERFKRGLLFDKLAASSSIADALIMHIYSPFHVARSDSALDTVDYSKAYISALSFFDGRFLPSMEYTHNLAPEKKIWITEWGAAFYGWKRKHEAGFIRKYYNALFVMNSLLTFFSTPYIESSHYHNFPYLWSDLKKQKANPLYYAMKLFKEPIRESYKIAPVQLTGAATYASAHPYYNGDSSEINAIFMHNKKAGYLFIVNKLGRQYLLHSLTGIDLAAGLLPVSFEQITPAKLEGPVAETVEHHKQIITNGAVIKIPSYSITRIYVKFKTDDIQSGQKNK